MEAKSLGRFGEGGYMLVKVLVMNVIMIMMIVMMFLMVAKSSRWGLAPC